MSKGNKIIIVIKDTFYVWCASDCHVSTNRTLKPIMFV